jgi:hypothetical protein
VLDDEAIPERLMARYPPAEITAAQFEQFAVELLTAGQSGQPELEDFRVQTLERIEGVGGSYIFDATVRFRLFGMDFLIVVEAKNHTHPIKRELVQILHSTTAVSRPRTGQASEPPEPAPEQRQRDERTSQRADSEQGARERFRHRTAPISHECIGDVGLARRRLRRRLLCSESDRPGPPLARAVLVDRSVSSTSWTARADVDASTVETVALTPE